MERWCLYTDTELGWNRRILASLPERKTASDGSNFLCSDAGFLVCGFLAVLVIILMAQKHHTKKKWIYVGICILAAAGITAGYDQFSGHALSDALQQIVQKETYDLEEIKSESDGVRLKYKGNLLKLIPEENEMGQILTAQINEEEKQTAFWDGESQSFIFNDKSFGSLKFDTYREKVHSI